MSNNNSNPSFLPKRYKKNVQSHFGVSVFGYICNEVAEEGALVVIDGAATLPTVKVATPGSCANGVFGMLAQKVYDASVYGPLENYKFHNNTWETLGKTVGVIVGFG